METETVRELSLILDAARQTTPSPQFLATLEKWLRVFAEHYRQEFSPEGIAIYGHALRDLTPEELERGCEKALAECEFIPKVAHIRQYAKPVFVYSDGSPSGRAWEEPTKCETCRDTGWRLVSNGQGGECATVCDCRKK